MIVIDRVLAILGWLAASIERVARGRRWAAWAVVGALVACVSDTHDRDRLVAAAHRPVIRRPSVSAHPGDDELGPPGGRAAFTNQR